ncbi:Predicted DHHC-type Zn-finger protein [Phaffia rhodozyma]|uniref:Palmitoyltransferase n=1 Tax=Phaffia rhodozyma TaxID=264483 RepID=A0A0F7SG74_PHARH|nr:Predicted DHHC-type Zn-finger protein [Phaffia rhodozyma]
MSLSTSSLPEASTFIPPFPDETLVAIPNGDISNASPDTSSSPNQKKKKFTPWEDAIERAEKKANDSAGEPDSWMRRKGTVPILIIIVGWTIYVVVVRIFVRMIQGRAFSKGRGISFLIIFILLFFMFTWSYLKITLTGPGLAKDYDPIEPSSDPLEGLPYPISVQPAPAPPPRQAGPPPFLTNQIPPVPKPSANTKKTSCPLVPPLFQERKAQVMNATQDINTSNPREELLERTPMEPERIGRWCGYCQLLKPPRTHHCRVCGTCVLNFDHHCDRGTCTAWVGGCVGQQNHKHFLVFSIWSTVFTGYVLIITALSLRGLGYDGTLISIIVLSTIFTIFTALLAVNHAWMIYNNLSTLEARIISDFLERESVSLSARFGYFQNSTTRNTHR